MTDPTPIPPPDPGAPLELAASGLDVAGTFEHDEQLAIAIGHDEAETYLDRVEVVALRNHLDRLLGDA